MKRTLLAMLILCLCTAAAMAADPRLEAMGDIGIGVVGSNMHSYPNPAAVFFDENDFTFAFSGNLGDQIGGGSWPYLPEGTVSAMFAAEMITMGLDVSLNTDNYDSVHDHVDSYLSSSLHVNFSAGYGPVSAGVRVSGGSVRQRLDVEMASVADIVMQTVMAQYDRVVNSEYIQVDAGFMLKVDQFSFGMILDDVLAKDGANTTFSLSSLLSDAGVGAYWSRAEYSARGRMNNFLFSGGLEFRKIFDVETIEMNVGGEVRFRMVRDSSVSLRAGFFSNVRSPEDGTLTAGVGVMFRDLDVAVNIYWPFEEKVSLKTYITLLF